MPDHLPGAEIPTKHKEAIRQLHKFAKIGLQRLVGYYDLGESTIRRVLQYDHPERARPTRTGRPRESLNDQEVRDIIEYVSESHEHRVLNYIQLHDELKLKCSAKTLERRLKEAGYFRCTACQKPFLTQIQARARWIWAIAHMFWSLFDWKGILWSDEVTFLIGGRKCKEKVTRKRGERFHPDCIQFQMHRGHTTPVHAFGAIGYGYKSQLLFITGTGKNGAFTQKNYLAQVLEKAIVGILGAFRQITLPEGLQPHFMEDGNSAHGHKSINNPCAIWRRKHGIILFPHPSTSPDMNPIEKCWRRIKQALHRRNRQPTNEAEMQAAVTELWNEIPQEWINGLIEKQEYWVHELVRRCGWSTPN
jgi:DDE superfamily endonuclease/Transposase